MDYHFSDGLRDLSPSAIREILKYASGSDIISFAAGNPSPEAFPVDVVADISDKILRDRPIDALQYSITEGYAPLRANVEKRMKEVYGVGGDGDAVLITAGAQQVMSLMTKTLCNPGDVIIAEDPSFIGSLNMFRSLNTKLVGVPMEADGMDMNALESALNQYDNVRFIYTIPNFQNPTGVTMSMAKREKLYALAKEHGVMILEDNPYGDLRFAGEDLPAIKTMDKDGIVTYAGSFSKVLSPGLRVGYAIGPAAVIAKMTVAKQGEDVHTNIWAQMISDEFMAGDFDAHLAYLRELYRGKAELMMALIEKELVPAGIQYYPVEGGLFVWCKLPEGANMKEFCTRAVKEKKVAVVPGNAFTVDEHAESDSIRLNYSTPTDEQMIEGMARLGDLAREMFGDK